MSSSPLGLEAASETSRRALAARILAIFLPVAIAAGCVLALLVAGERRRHEQALALRQEARLALNEEIIGFSLKRFGTDALMLARLCRLEPSAQAGLPAAGVAVSRLGALALAFAQARGDYLQVRLLSLAGQEVVRVNREGATFRLAGPRELQDKSGRPYFRDCRALAPGIVSFSGPELNQEHGAVEEPRRPVLRVCTPVVGAGERPVALAVLNFPAAPFLDRLRERDATALDRLWITDGRGSWARGPSSSSEWGADYGFPPGTRAAEWGNGALAAAAATPSGRLRTAGGWVAVRRIDPAAAATIPAAGTPLRATASAPWTLVSFAPAATAEAALRRSIRTFAGVYALFLLLTLLAAARIGQLQLARQSLARRDREQQEELAAAENRFRRFFENGLGFVCRHDLEGRLLEVNPAAASALGYTPEELAGRSLAELIAPRHRSSLATYLARIRTAEVVEGFFHLCSRGGDERIWRFHNRRIAEPTGPPFVLGSALDVTAQRHAELLLAEQATRDPLTGLVNRRSFDDHLAHAFAAAQRHLLRGDPAGGELAVGMLDLDGFKPVNDRYGHAAGDELLRAVGTALEASVRRTDFVARMGGDEFALLLAEAGEPTALAALAGKLLAAVTAAARAAVPEASVTASLGLARFAATTASPEDLMRAADDALYAAKQAGRNRTFMAPESEEQSRTPET